MQTTDRPKTLLEAFDELAQARRDLSLEIAYALRIPAIVDWLARQLRRLERRFGREPAKVTVTYHCAICDQDFVSEFDDEQAKRDAADGFGVHPDENPDAFDVICDACYQKHFAL